MIGQTISHYKITEKLGGGGMGVVYKAEDTTLKRTVALKFLPPEFTFDPEAKQRFLYEAQAASALDHPNICTIYDVGQTDDGPAYPGAPAGGQTYIVMAYYDGETLSEKIKASNEDGRSRIENRGRGISIEEALDIASQICQGLSRAHESGIIHRDIKPANIMLTSRGEAKILDFGLAKLAGQSKLTRTGTTLGTAAYMSPEQARSETVDQRSDLWSLGVVLYQMLAGRLPFPAENEQALLYSIVNEAPRPLHKGRTEIPEALGQIVQKTLAKKPEERYQTADELLADLKVITGGKETAGATLAGRLAKKSSRRKTMTRIGLGAVVVAIGTLAYLFVSPILQENALASNPKTIAVISFENQTGDATQDHLRNVLQDAIITSLEQSKYFRVTTRERIADILKQIGKRDVEYVDRDLGMEICRREGAEVLAVGSFASAGEEFRTSVKLVDVATLRTLKTYTASGKGVESLLAEQIDDLSSNISRGFGISTRQTEAMIRPIDEIATTSTLAYQLYLRGQEYRQRIKGAEARRYFELAVKEDSLFVSAWIDLDFACLMTGDGKAAGYARRKAISLFAKASEKERFRIAYMDTSLRSSVMGRPHVGDLEFVRHCVEKFPNDKQFLWVLATELGWRLGQWDDAIAVLKRILDLDPRYGSALNQLGYAYSNKGETDKAIETMKHYVEVFPRDANPYDSMGDVYFAAGNLDEAIANFARAGILDSALNSWESFKIARAYFSLERYDDAVRWNDSLLARAATPENRADVLWHRAYCMHWLGRLSEAASLLRRREPLLRALGQQTDGFVEAWIACDRGEFAKSRSFLRQWTLRMGRGSSEKQSLAEMLGFFCLANVDLREGKLDSVEARLAGMDSIRKAIPAVTDSSVALKMIASVDLFGSWLLRAELLIARGRPADVPPVVPQQARKRILPSVGFPDGPGWCGGSDGEATHIPITADYLARAYAAMGLPDSAIALYERGFSTKPAHELYPPYHYRLALLYEQKDMKEKAITEYEKFLKIWGKADPIYKEPADAKKRLAMLKRG